MPLFGYRRKSYLIVANIAGDRRIFLGHAGSPRPSDLAFALMLTAYAMAISSTLCGAVLVENGQRLHESGTFVNQQWLWYNIAAMAAAISAANWCSICAPALLCIPPPPSSRVAPFAVIVGTRVSDPREKSRRSICRA